MILLLLTAPALAQGVPDPTTLTIDAQNYRPPIDARTTLWTEDATTRGDGWFGARLFVHYASDPLVYRAADGTETELVADVVQANLAPAVHFKQLRLGVDLPLNLSAQGEAVTRGTGIGDIAVDLKYTVLDPEAAPLGLAVDVRIIAPTATTEGPLGLSGTGSELVAIVDKPVGDWRFVGNLGTRLVPPTELENVTVDDQFLFRLGAGHALGSGGYSLDLAGLGTYGELGNRVGFPLEGMLGGWMRFGSFVARAGVGTGLSAGIGTPTFRGVAGLAFEPDGSRDSDGDGISDREDGCPELAEDVDGYQDADGCPDPSTTLMVRFVDEDGSSVPGVVARLSGEGGKHDGEGDFAEPVHAGVYTLQAQAPGYEGAELELSVPEAPSHKVEVLLAVVKGAVRVKLLDPDGKPIAGEFSLTSTFAPVTDEAVTARPGEYVLRVRAPNYRIERVPVTVIAGKEQVVEVRLKPTKIKVTKERIDLQEKVYFDTGKATIKPESFEMLDEVAGVLRDNPEITRMRIEGHTDSRGSASSNKKLSEARAASVRQYLVDKGVSGDRLVSVGYGEERPLDPANNAKAWEKNRRVDLFIEEWKDQ